jgi:hypothetical protein
MFALVKKANRLVKENVNVIGNQLQLFNRLLGQTFSIKRQCLYNSEVIGSVAVVYCIPQLTLHVPLHHQTNKNAISHSEKLNFFCRRELSHDLLHLK